MKLRYLLMFLVRLVLFPFVGVVLVCNVVLELASVHVDWIQWRAYNEGYLSLLPWSKYR